MRVKRVGVFRTIFPNPSDTFVYQQALNYRRYKPTFLVRTKLSSIDIDTIALSDEDRTGLKQKYHSLTASPAYFVKRTAGIDLVHVHFGTDAIYGLELAKALRIPLIVTFHGSDITTSKKSLIFSKKPSVYHFLAREKELISYTSRFIAVSNFIQSKLIERGYPAEKVTRNYIGINTDAFTPGHSETTGRYILNVARHVPVKGIDTLIKSFAIVAKNYPDTSLIQIGSGPETEALKHLAYSLGLETRINFLGPRSHQEVLSYMQGAEAFVLPSQTCESGQTEALGIVLNEASACGVPVIGTRSGGIEEAILDGHTGFLVSERAPEMLANRLERILGNPELKYQLGRNGRAWVCKYFNIKRQTEELEAIYDEVINYK